MANSIHPLGILQYTRLSMNVFSCLGRGQVPVWAYQDLFPCGPGGLLGEAPVRQAPPQWGAHTEAHSWVAAAEEVPCTPPGHHTRPGPCQRVAGTKVGGADWVWPMPGRCWHEGGWGWPMPGGCRHEGGWGWPMPGSCWHEGGCGSCQGVAGTKVGGAGWV